MLHRHFRNHRHVATLVALVGLVALASPVRAGFLDGGATEWTQIANNAELVEILKSSGQQVDNQLTQITQLAEQIQNQLKIYQNMLQNTARLPEHMWGEVESELETLRQIIDQGQSISFSMGNADTVLKQRFRSYDDLQASTPDGTALSTTYASWSQTNRDTIASTLKAASLTADQFDSEQSTMSALRTMSETSDGQLKALQTGHEIAVQEVAQIQKLRGLVAQQMTMMGTWLQAEQTAKDLNQARLEKFFNAQVSDIPDGQKMEPRW
jgi:P-type conjugative transfer protein TrbJ